MNSEYHLQFIQYCTYFRPESGNTAENWRDVHNTLQSKLSLYTHQKVSIRASKGKKACKIDGILNLCRDPTSFLQA